MSTTLREELKQTRPLVSLAEEAYLNLARTVSVLQGAFEPLFERHGLTETQYNVLRILRGAGPGGLCRADIRERMLTRMPDVTRLLDRMEEARLIVRQRSDDDRRLVNTTLTPQGRALVDALDDEVSAQHQRLLGHFTHQQLRTLVRLLTIARAPAVDRPD